jgi:hypothetical protein
LLSQWRGYADDGNGVSIGFDSTRFGVRESSLPVLRQVIYDPAEQRKTIQPTLDEAIDLLDREASRGTAVLAGGSDEKVKEEVLSLPETMFLLFPHLYTLKNPAFREEKEWRSITLIPSNPAQIRMLTDEEEDQQKFKNMNFRALRDRIVPYMKLPLDTKLGGSTITEVILRPRNITPISIAKACLMRNEWPDVDIKKSTASYR